MSIPVIILAIVFVMIAVRQIGNIKLQIWQILLFGAIAALLTGSISPINAIKSINVDVIFFLFGMFVVGQALDESGYLSHLSYNLFKRAKSIDSLILFILFGIGLLSAILMNDTLAIIGTPVVLLLAKKHRTNPKLLLLALAFAITIGSAASPIGNPQNLLIAVNGNIPNPFITFLKFLLIPTAINLVLAYILLKLFYKDEFHNGQLDHSQEPIKDHRLAVLSKLSLALIIAMVILKVVLIFLDATVEFRLTYIALISALPILLFSPKRAGILKRIDWRTLLFFAAMFIVMQSAWDAGFFQSLISKSHVDITSVFAVIAISVVLSQLISNVPLVTLYLPMLAHAGASTREMMALAAGSTIAGNLFILGAASNVIIIQNAEGRAGETLTFMEFAKVGIPLTVLNVLVYWVFI